MSYYSRSLEEEYKAGYQAGFEAGRACTAPPQPEGVLVPTFDSERALLVKEVGECCMGADPFCVTGCLVEKALRKRQSEIFTAAPTSSAHTEQAEALREVSRLLHGDLYTLLTNLQNNISSPADAQIANSILRRIDKLPRWQTTAPSRGTPEDQDRKAALQDAAPAEPK